MMFTFGCVFFGHAFKYETSTLLVCHRCGETLRIEEEGEADDRRP